MSEAKCGSCRWWDVRYSSYHPYGPMGEGRCRKGLPSNNGGTGQWPVTEKSDWCGEHTPKGEDL